MFRSLGILFLTLNTLAAPNRPFPQHTRYASGTILPSHRTQTQLDDDVRAYYAAWKSQRGPRSVASRDGCRTARRSGVPRAGAPHRGVGAHGDGRRSVAAARGLPAERDFPPRPRLLHHLLRRADRRRGDDGGGQQEWLNDLYDAVRARHEDYYEDSVTLLCLLVMSGNAWSPLETKRRAMRH